MKDIVAAVVVIAILAGAYVVGTTYAVAKKVFR